MRGIKNTDMQKINSKNWLGNIQNKMLAVHLDKEDWQRLIPMSGYMRMAPSKLGRVLLKQMLLQFQRSEWLDSDVFKLTTQVPHVRNLSTREMQILKLAAEGTSNKGIAEILGIREQTTKNYISSILRKLNVENRTQAVVLAFEQNLIEPKMSSQNNHNGNFRLVSSVRREQ
jgi:DNA-binding NarL/FixJ family response regulator